MKCLNTSSIEYGDLKRSSTLSEPLLQAHCASFLKKHDRLPRLDEIPGSNSSKYISEQLKVNKNGGVDTQKLLEFTGQDSIDSAVIHINNNYVDTQVEAVDLGDRAILTFEQRPTDLPKEIETIYEPDETSNLFIIEQLDKLRTAYGYDFKEVTNFDLEQEEWKHLMPFNKTVKAFIYNGDIYINTDNADTNSKIHEMLHLLVGSIRFADPKLYTKLLESVINIPNAIDLAAQLHPDKTRNDAIEELFVSEISKKLIGLDSDLQLSNDQLYEIKYNIKRTLDTILFGDYSTKIISDNNLLGMSLKEVAKKVNSSKMTNQFKFDEGSELHRILANRKSELLKDNSLIEICE